MSEEDFETFFARMLPRAVRVGRRVTGDPWLAEDVAVEALAKAHARWARVGPLPWRDAWLLKVASREALRHLRRKPGLAAPSDRGNESDEVVLRAALAAALARLPRRQREAISLRYLCDLSEADVAAALGVSAGTVKTLAADFSGITGRVALHVQAVQQDADLRVSPDGTVGAAVTGVSVEASSLPMLPSPTFDHPFLFVVRATTTGAVLFEAAVEDPSAR